VAGESQRQFAARNACVLKTGDLKGIIEEFRRILDRTVFGLVEPS
jgi:hypothetical protein